ncbi:MAG: hypothetical protein ABIO87_00470 [Chthoniobacterales bacterium]
MRRRVMSDDLSGRLIENAGGQRRNGSELDVLLLAKNRWASQEGKGGQGSGEGK